MSTSFSAGPQALGYLYQARFSLYQILCRPLEAEVLIENLDDIVFDLNGQSVELLQLKHHVNMKASLTDSSSELWKTLRIWSTGILENTLQVVNTTFTLITTANAPDNSIAALLGSKNRQSELAVDRLRTITTTSTADDLQPSFIAFMALTLEQQKMLVDAIVILNNSPDISDTSSIIKDKLRNAIRREHLDGLFERLEGWWFDQVVKHLRAGSKTPICGLEVQTKIRDIAEQFLPNALPIDFMNAFPPISSSPDTDPRRFVLQLRMIGINSARIEKAILDYYRAFEQRSRWVRDELLIEYDLEEYEKTLVDEWERYFLALKDEVDVDQAHDDELMRIGREIFRWVDQDANFRIRPNVSEAYVIRGSYHILADKNPPSVWWHPHFSKRLEELLTLA